MAWNDSMVLMLRLTIDDMDSTDYKYEDDRLEQQLLLAAQLMQGGEITFPNTYTISVSEITLSPDPTVVGDNVFINLVVLKAACLLEKTETRLAAEQGIDISDVGSRIALTGRAQNKIALLQKGGFCEDYKKAKQEYLLGVMNPGLAVLSPFRIFAGYDASDSVSFDPRYYR